MRSFLEKVILLTAGFYMVSYAAFAWQAPLSGAVSFYTSPHAQKFSDKLPGTASSLALMTFNAATADLKITLQKSGGSIAPNEYQLGDEITYTITVENTGPGAEIRINASISLFGRVKSQAAGKGAAIINPAPDNAMSSGAWVVDRLANGERVTLTVVTTVRVASNASADVSVRGAGVDSNQSNNFSTLFLCVVPAAAGGITGPAVVCVNQPYTYRIAPVPGASFYAWEFPEGWEVVFEDGKEEVALVKKAGASGTITVAVGNTCGQGPAKAFEVRAIPGLPVISAPIAGPAVVCAGSKGLTYSIPEATDAAAYTWRVPAGWKIITGQNGTEITVEAGSEAGVVSVTASNACGSTTQALNVSARATLPATPTLEGPAEVCQDTDGYVYSIDEVPGATKYTWTAPDDWNIAGQGTPEITVKAGRLEGNVSVTVTNACGGVTVSKAIAISTAKPAEPGAITGETTVCAGSKATYSIAPATGASSYVWEVPPGWTILKGQGTVAVEVEAGAAAGSVKVMAKNSCGLSGKRAFPVAPVKGVPAKPAIIKAETTSFCQGKAGLVYSIDQVAGAASYVWEVPASWAITSGQTTTTITVTAGSERGEIKVAAANTCGAGEGASLEVRPQQKPAMPAAIVGAPAPCTGKTVEYRVPAQEGIEHYTWEMPAGWAVVAGQGTHTVLVRPTAAAGLVEVKAGNACGVSEARVLEVRPVSEFPAVAGAIRGQTSVCAGRSITYSIDAAPYASAYTWALPQGWAIAEGQGTTAITVTAGSNSGTISVTAGNGCGVSPAATLEVQSLALADPGSIQDRSSACSGLIYEVAPVAGAATYTWTLPEGWAITSGNGTSRIAVAPGESEGIISLVVDNGICSSEPVSIMPDKSLGGNELVFPNVFSPNNDGNNDIWAIQHLQNYPDNDLTILNRWGNEVYKKKSYKNDWGGDNLSEGTYFYIARVRMCNGADKVYKGYVMLVR